MPSFLKFFFATLVAVELYAATASASGSILKKETIPGQYSLGIIQNVKDITDEEVTQTMRQIHKEWKEPHIQIAWLQENGTPLVVGEISTSDTISIIRPKNKDNAEWLKKGLAFPTTPGTLSSLYQENSILADDNFRNKTVIFQSVAGDISRGAFNKPYVFFQSAADPNIGLTCYFNADDASLRKIRKGSRVIVRGKVKGFLMQDVILEECSILSILQ